MFLVWHRLFFETFFALALPTYKTAHWCVLKVFHPFKVLSEIRDFWVIPKRGSNEKINYNHYKLLTFRDECDKNHSMKTFSRSRKPFLWYNWAKYCQNVSSYQSTGDLPSYVWTLAASALRRTDQVANFE